MQIYGQIHVHESFLIKFDDGATRETLFNWSRGWFIFVSDLGNGQHEAWKNYGKSTPINKYQLFK
jgi:hypothetical protein